MEPIYLKPGRKKLAIAFAISTMFVVLGTLFVAFGATYSFNWWVGVGNVAFFGLGVIVLGAQLIPGVSGLLLEARGFTVVTLGRRRFTSWTDVAGFWPGKVSGQPMVLYDYAPHASTAVSLKKVNRLLAGHDAGLPDAYGYDVTELADLMNRLRETAAAE